MLNDKTVPSSTTVWQHNRNKRCDEYYLDIPPTECCKIVGFPKHFQRDELVGRGRERLNYFRQCRKSSRRRSTMLRLGIPFSRAALEQIEKPLETRLFGSGAICSRQLITTKQSKGFSNRSNKYDSGLRGFATATGEPRKTCLYDVHLENNGKVVNFAGWLLPVQYRDAIAVSHQHTRTYASLFDVGHMMQTRVTGKYAGEFLESLTTADLKNLPQGAASLTVFTNDNGGILDDLIITKDAEDKYFVVSNAGRRNEDSQLLNQRKKEFDNIDKSVSLQFLDPLEQGLVALQGPTAAEVLQSHVKIDLTKLKFMNSVETKISNIETRISRCGYTGEDGFEISVGGKDARGLVEKILENTDVKMAGLGARDSLRLEAGLCLYGHDINEETTPVEAGLTWLVAKRRRAEANFPGAKTILSQIKTGVRKKRIGLMLGQGPPARENAPILTPEGEKVGRVTSGGPSPTLGRPIAMGYVPPDLAQNGGGVLIEVRGKTYKATITKMPFVKANYYNGK